MPNSRRGVSRREMLGWSAVTLATAAFSDLISASEAQATGPVSGIRHFARFGVDERMIRETLGEALATGGDWADVYFQHRVGSSLVLEDGSVNRALGSVELGVGVRVVKGDQTGYGYTEELTLDALKRAAATAASIADGPSRAAPTSFRADPGPAGTFPARYMLDHN